jgi:thioesterase domain-containing protein
MGFSGKKNPYTSMEEIAAHYIAEILDNNPNGPYALAGYSFGGVIAFEMTRQLESMGKTVIMLGLLDSYAENADYFYPKTIKWAKKISRQFPKMWFITKSFFQNPKRTITYQLEYIERRRNEFAAKLGLSKNNNTDEISQKINAAYETAYRNYKMQKYNGQLDVFRVKTRLYYLADREFLGWLPFAKKGVKVHEINGDHKTFLMPPRDKAFAQTLQDVLDERAKEFGY